MIIDMRKRLRREERKKESYQEERVRSGRKSPIRKKESDLESSHWSGAPQLEHLNLMAVDGFSTANSHWGYFIVT